MARLPEALRVPHALLLPLLLHRQMPVPDAMMVPDDRRHVKEGEEGPHLSHPIVPALSSRDPSTMSVPSLPDDCRN